jgi:hypothetical protein
MPTERPPLVGEVSANFLRKEGCHVVSSNLSFLDGENFVQGSKFPSIQNYGCARAKLLT